MTAGDEPGRRAVPAPPTPDARQRAAAARPIAEPRANRARPDAGPLRLLAGLVGIASASAIATAMLPSITPQPAAQVLIADVAPAPTPSVVHVTKYVQLKAGQTAPPAAPVVVRPTPTPRVHVVITRQSGKP